MSYLSFNDYVQVRKARNLHNVASGCCNILQPLLMRSGDVNVNIFTAMIGTLVFGIGVDDAIHVMHRIQEEGESAVGLSNAVSKPDQLFLRLQQYLGLLLVSLLRSLGLKTSS